MINLLCDFSSVGKTILNVLLAFVVLMVMVLIHELGHYTAGKILKFKINEFAVGMGPKILWHKKKNGEVISLRLLPLGGFCAFEGEDGENENPQAFNKQKPWKRLIVLFAGAFFNFVSALVLAVFVFWLYGVSTPVVSNVFENSPAYGVIQENDIVDEVDGHKIYISTDYAQFMPKDADVKFSITVVRNGERIVINDLYKTDVSYVGDDGSEHTYVGVGVQVNPYYLHKYSFGQSLARAFPYCCSVAKLVLRTLGGLFTGSVGLDQVGGPISTISVTSQVVEQGFGNVLTLIILISVNLAVFNLLPVPALDGCRMVFVIIEWIAGRPINRKVEAYINGIGLVLLLVFMILIDLLKL